MLGYKRLDCLWTIVFQGSFDITDSMVGKCHSINREPYVKSDKLRLNYRSGAFFDLCSALPTSFFDGFFFNIHTFEMSVLGQNPSLFENVSI